MNTLKTMNDREEEDQNEDLEEAETDEAAMSTLADGNVEISHDTEMQVPTANNVHRTRDDEKEVELPQTLAILEYLALNSAWGRILKNGHVLSIHEKNVSKIGATGKIKEAFLAISGNVPKSALVGELSIYGEPEGVPAIMPHGISMREGPVFTN